MASQAFWRVLLRSRSAHAHRIVTWGWSLLGLSCHAAHVGRGFWLLAAPAAAGSGAGVFYCIVVTLKLLLFWDMRAWPGPGSHS